MLLEICATLVRAEDRFAQTGGGWVLRELSVANPAMVAEFIREHICSFSAEGLRYAVEKMSPELAGELKSARKNARR